ncbi:MAG TPA: zf-HC2 domain-containing protein [Candidatus Binatia bacterium]|nr:zf-HC2 domain-containing protein [Candidatus Binatia bacterium]
MDCEGIRRWLAAYGDDELSVESALEVERHLLVCASCRSLVERQRQFASTVARLYPRAILPPGLEERVTRGLRLRPQRVWLRTFALAASLLLVIGVVWRAARERVGTAPASVLAAIEIHRAAPPALAIRSADPAAVNEWLAHALPYPLNDPVQPPSDFVLEGAATIELGGERVGYVRYRYHAQPISLFLLSPRPWPARGRRVNLRAVEFHLFDLYGLQAIAWNHSPLSYVLVSELNEKGEHACAVCHGGTANAAAFRLGGNET